MLEITSRDNDRLKLARRVRDGNESELIFIEGARLCAEAFSTGIDAECAFVTRGFLESGTLRPFKNRLSRAYLVSERLLKSIADTAAPQGIVILAGRPSADNSELLAEPDNQYAAIFLHQVNNPSNLGAIVRTAEAAGVRKILVSNGSADHFSPKALRASMGSAFRARISSGLDIVEAVEAARNNGYVIVAVDARGTSVYSQKWRDTKHLFIFGSEAHGLSKVKRSYSDLVISIPMEAPVESLNLAVSCGIVLYEVRRQIEWNN